MGMYNVTGSDLAGSDQPGDAVIRVRSLLNGDDGSKRHTESVLRLLGIVTEWGTDAELAVTIGVVGARGRVHMELSPSGAVPADWASDLRWAVGELASVSRAARTVFSQPREIAELKMSRDLPEDQFASPDVVSSTPVGDGVTTELQRHRRVRASTPWPQGYHASIADLFDLRIPGLTLRYRLSAASNFERGLLAEALDQSWPDSRDAYQDYLGPAVRTRVLIGARDPLPARARSLVYRWATGITIVPLDHRVQASAWQGDSLIGRALPLGAAAAIIRLPIAADEVFPGMPSAVPIPASRRLDPVPAKPARAVRLGRAKAASGGWIDASVDLLDLAQHTFVQGASGSGKSTMLAALATAIQNAGGSYTLLDPEGSTVDLLTMQTPPEMVASTRVIRHGVDDLDLPVNIFANGVGTDVMLDLFAEMMQRAFDPNGSGFVGPRWRRWFGLIANGTHALLGDDATLVSVAAIASDMDRVKRLAMRLKAIDPELAHRLNAEYGNLSNDSSGDLVSWASSKFQPLLASDPTRWILGTPGPGIDVLDTMETRTSLAIDLGMHRLGTTGARMVGALWLLKFWAAMQHRVERDQTHVLLIDEAHLFQYGALPELLAQARKFGIGVVVATQHLGQLSDELSDALESNTGSFVCLRSGLQSAARASSRLEGWPVKDLVRLPNLTAAASISRNGTVSSPFTLRVDSHERLRRSKRIGVIGSHVAETILDSSKRLAGAAIGGASPLTESQIADLLANPRVDPSDGVGEPSAEGSFLDQWLAARQGRAAPSPS